MVVYESTWFCWEAQGLEQGKFLQMRSFRVLAFLCLASLALVEHRAWTCGDAFCGSWPHITNRRIASSVPRNGGCCLFAELCVGWILEEEDIEAWMDAHGVQSFETLIQEGDGSDDWVGDDGKGNVLPPDWLVRCVDDYSGIGRSERTWVLTLCRAGNLTTGWKSQGLRATDLKSLLADTDSMARGAALAADMGNNGPLQIIAVPGYYH